MNPHNILNFDNTFAIVGASADPDRYGYELVHVMHQAGYKVFPVNPKYKEIIGIPCYPSLHDIPEKPDVVITALAPGNSIKAIETAAGLGIKSIWMPPDCWSDEAIAKCKSLNLNFVNDICPIYLIKLKERK